MRTKVDYPEKECLYCKQLFKPNRIDKGFCNPTCRKLYGKKYKGHSKGDPVTRNKRQALKKSPYRKYKKLSCELCGFIPHHPCQLDVDHIDGNHFNNLVENLQTLCANCHRLKTAIQLGWYK